VSLFVENANRKDKYKTAQSRREIIAATCFESKPFTALFFTTGFISFK
jgi:hypothetical protein